MPGNLSAASPSGVFPQVTYTQMPEMRHFEILSNTFHDGSLCQSLITDTVNAPESIRSWNLAVRLTPTQVVTVRNFYESMNGGLSPFYWYNPYEYVSYVGDNYDSTGTQTTGRHTVKFTNPYWFETTTNAARTNIQFTLLEIA
jgi:phage-related protein